MNIKGTLIFLVMIIISIVLYILLNYAAISPIMLFVLCYIIVTLIIMVHVMWNIK